MTVPFVLGKDWTSEVIRLANIIGHALVPNGRDNGTPEHFHAYHAEKQLIAYLVRQHVFLETEYRASKKTCESLDTYYRFQGALEEAILEGECEEGGTLHEPAAKIPPTSLKQAGILVSSPSCSDCMCFTKVINAKLDLRIKLQHRAIHG